MVGDGRQRRGAASAAVVGEAAVELRWAVGGKGMDGERAAVAEGKTPHVDARGRARPLTQGRTPPLTQGRPQPLTQGRTRLLTQVGPQPMTQGGLRTEGGT